MPRNISFAFTTPQFRDRTKTVTRRNGWLFLKVGDVLCGVEKSQGLGKGGKIKRLGAIRVIDVHREKIRCLTDDLDYGFAECIREGFPPPHPKSRPSEFVEFFCNSHRGTTPESIITRIEFEYLDAAPAKAEAA
jgi:hypothetical protein